MCLGYLLLNQKKYLKMNYVLIYTSESEVSEKQICRFWRVNAVLVYPIDLNKFSAVG